VSAVEEVDFGSLDPERFQELLGDDYDDVADAIETADAAFAGRTIWHVNSTARGGGVAELLRSLLAYTRGAGVDSRWAVIAGDPEFFAITKRIHNRLHGSVGDGGALGAHERTHYEATLARAADGLSKLVGPDDIVFLHDPQTAGLVAPMKERAAIVIWRCHVGLDDPNGVSRDTWRFLAPFVERADAKVFSRPSFVWDVLGEDDVWIVPPSIDAFSAKNQDLASEAVDAIVAVIGLGPGGARGEPHFIRPDGSVGRVERVAEIEQGEPVPADAILTTQVSRWDALKDPLGVLRGFVECVPDPRCHLLLAGPANGAVADDPESVTVLADVLAARERLEPDVRVRVHVASLPMDDIDENAAMVNAIQRRSDVVVQKSLQEGFGLTVAEAMWKGKPVVAAARGGIRDQIVDGESGILLADPADLTAYGAAVRQLTEDPEERGRIGSAARRSVTESFLGTRQLLQYMELLRGLLVNRR
jgi:trehalose synthase